MSSITLRPNSPDADQSTGGDGTLQVEVPHWATQLTVFNDLFHVVATVGSAPPTPTATGTYETTIQLRAGIYEIEATLGSRSERQLVPVQANSTTSVPGSTWKHLELPSVAPLAGTATVREPHTAAATEWSTRITWPDAPGGEGRLFLFLRSRGEKPTKTFADGLCLLDAAGRCVTDFSDGVQRDNRAGWLAFNANLPAGYYILRRARQGVRRRYQPIYLPPHLVTQVFLEATRFPRLHSLVMNMAAPGQGFRPDDEAAVAAQVVLESLGRTTSGDFVASETVAPLLEGERENPWLGVVAAYALRAAQDRGQPASKLPKVLDFLQRRLADHPDVRALLLKDDEPASSPFWYPPLLRMGLRFVQQHAARHEKTLPLDSLTDVVLDSLVTNAPWTAWRELDRVLVAPPDLPPINDAGKTLLAVKRPVATTAGPAADPALAGDPSVSVGQSMLHVARFLGGDEEHAEAGRSDSLLAADMVAATLEDPSFYQSIASLFRGGGGESLNETISLNLQGAMKRLLDTVEPKEVSEQSSLSLPRAESSLKSLRGHAALDDSRTAAGDPAAVWAPTQADQAVMQTALRKATRSARQAVAPAFAADDPGTTGTPSEASPAVAPVTADESIAKLRAEADRLALAAERAATTEAENPEPMRRLASRIDRIADELLKRMDFIVVTDAGGRKLAANGAFDALLTSSGTVARRRGPEAAEQARAARRANWPVWEALFTGAPIGSSTVATPVPNPFSPNWQLVRHVVEDAQTKAIWAYLNVLRVAGTVPLTTDALTAVASVVPDLTLYAPLMAYGSPESRGESAERIDELAAQLESIIGVPGTAAPG
jgi:hypothetical protein